MKKTLVAILLLSLLLGAAFVLCACGGGGGDDGEFDHTGDGEQIIQNFGFTDSSVTPTVCHLL